MRKPDVVIYTKEGRQEMTYRKWDKFFTPLLEFHREDGPAIEIADGDKVWALGGKYYSKEELNKEIQKVRDMNYFERKLDEREWVRNWKE